MRLDGQVLASEVHLLLRLAAVAGETSVTGYGEVEEARALNRHGTAATAGPPIPMARVEELGISGPAGTIPARLYDRAGSARRRGRCSSTTTAAAG